MSSRWRTAAPSLVIAPASDFENDSLGKQAPPDPFTSGVQCKYNNVNNLTDMAWLDASFAPSSAADQVKQGPNDRMWRPGHHHIGVG
jgi:hypothetical protein